MNKPYDYCILLVYHYLYILCYRLSLKTSYFQDKKVNNIDILFNSFGMANTDSIPQGEQARSGRAGLLPRAEKRKKGIYSTIVISKILKKQKGAIQHHWRCDPGNLQGGKVRGQARAQGEQWSCCVHPVFTLVFTPQTLYLSTFFLKVNRVNSKIAILTKLKLVYTNIHFNNYIENSVRCVHPPAKKTEKH